MSRPWMPLYVADYRNDTAHLSAAESGAYLHLIMHYWSAGGLPDDDRQLARIASMSAKEWKKVRPIVQAFFHDGWKHKRIDIELAKAADISSKRAASAKQKRSNSSANAPAIAEQLDTHTRASSPSQSPEEREDTADAVLSSATSYAFESGIVRLTEEDFKKWETAFPRLDLRAELTGMSEWANQQGNRWFHAVSGLLAKRNREAKTALEKPRISPSDRDWKEAIL